MVFWYIFRYAILDSEGFRALICAFYLQMVALKIAKCGFPIRLDSLKVHRNSMTIFAIGNGIAANHLQKKKKKICYCQSLGCKYYHCDWFQAYQKDVTELKVGTKYTRVVLLSQYKLA